MWRGSRRWVAPERLGVGEVSRWDDLRQKAADRRYLAGSRPVLHICRGCGVKVEVYEATHGATTDAEHRFIEPGSFRCYDCGTLPFTGK